MTVLMREAIKPNLVQTLEGGPAFIHAGPFANIAHGNSSVVADRIALKLVDAVVTEAGFGSDMGFQKFIDIKCRLSGIRPAAAVIVATIRALKMHGGVGHVVAGKPLDPALARGEPGRRPARLREPGRSTSRSSRGYGIPAVVAINAFPTDKQSEIDVVREAALAAGARDAVVSDHFAARRRGRRGPGACRLGGRERGRARLPLPDARRRHARRAHRGDRHARLRRGRRRHLGRGGQAAARVRAAGLRPPAGVHGQDGTVAQPRSRAQGPARPASACPFATRACSPAPAS